jgi:hypothetical protein
MEDGLQPDPERHHGDLHPHELGDGGAHRVVYMDGRKHPADVFPTWYGHSIGHWEGDTLGHRHRRLQRQVLVRQPRHAAHEKLHTIERFSRPNFGTLINEFTIDDPGAYSRTVQLKFTARRVRQDVELMEDICTENNQAGIAGGYKLNPNRNRDRRCNDKEDNGLEPLLTMRERGGEQNSCGLGDGSDSHIVAVLANGCAAAHLEYPGGRHAADRRQARERSGAAAA